MDGGEVLWLDGAFPFLFASGLATSRAALFKGRLRAERTILHDYAIPAVSWSWFNGQKAEPQACHALGRLANMIAAIMRLIHPVVVLPELFGSAPGPDNHAGSAQRIPRRTAPHRAAETDAIPTRRLSIVLSVFHGAPPPPHEPSRMEFARWN